MHLDRCTMENTPSLPLSHLRYARVIHVDSGNTCVLAFEYQNKLYRHPCRLRGYTCHQRWSSSTSTTKSLAKLSLSQLEGKVLGKTVELLGPVEWDCDGRLLADLKTETTLSIATHMVHYGGGMAISSPC